MGYPFPKIIIIINNIQKVNSKHMEIQYKKLSSSKKEYEKCIKSKCAQFIHQEVKNFLTKK